MERGCCELEDKIEMPLSVQYQYDFFRDNLKDVDGMLLAVIVGISVVLLTISKFNAGLV